MNKIDLRKELKEFYQPSAKQVVVVDVPAFQFAMLDGEIEPGASPGTSLSFQQALEALYGIAYTLKFASKLRKIDPIDYTVMGLEGLWWVEGGEFNITNPSGWRWTAMILQPDHITMEMFQEALAQLRKKKPNPALDFLRLERFHEGLCMQIMHIGPYAAEPATITRMEAFAQENGYRKRGKHHEIYLSDPRRSDPARLKTVLRQPIEKVEAMSLQPLPGFIHFPTHHCVTGSLRHIYAFNGYPISEEMLLGLGAGVGFIYWHMKEALPFLGGRANIERPGVEGLEKTIGRRTGVQVQTNHTRSPTRAEHRLIDLLQAGQPAMLILDMGYLPYFDFGGEEFHFGYHVVVACGYDPANQEVLIADRDEPLHAVPMTALRQARGSTYKPFPPQHGWHEFDFSQKRPFEPDELRQAIRDAARDMLKPPITNLGVKGIRKAAQRISKWPTVLDEKMLREACINTAILVDARGGTGGGLFRYMYARFLLEAAEYTNLDDLKLAAGQMQAAGDGWQEVAALFEQAYQAELPAKVLDCLTPLLLKIADEEQQVWERLIIAAEFGGAR